MYIFLSSYFSVFSNLHVYLFLIQNQWRGTNVSSLSKMNTFFYQFISSGILDIQLTLFNRQLGITRDLLPSTVNIILSINTSLNYIYKLFKPLNQLIQITQSYSNYKRHTPMTNQQQLNEIKQKYLDSMNRVNLLLLKQHDLRRDQKIYQLELEKVQLLISQVEKGRTNGINVIAEDNYLRQQIKQNQKQIRKLQRKLKGQQIYSQVNQLKNIQQKYLDMISNQFQNGIQQKLSTIRGKVDQLKKKIKQINKQILSFEQEHMQGLDEYSLYIFLLKDYQEKNKQLKETISKLKQMQKK